MNARATDRPEVGARATLAQVDDALAWLRATVAAEADLSADSRSIKAGDVFLAYAVEGADNRGYIDAAFAQGAAAVLYQPEGLSRTPIDTRVRPVAALDRLAGLLASVWYGEPSESMLSIGITGTNGKTSCSHWIAQALDGLGRRCAVIGTLGNGFLDRLEYSGFTTPDAAQLQRSLALARHAGADAVSMEVSSHALHQGRVNGTVFDIAVFTNLTQDHLDYHQTFEAYEAAKARLFDWPGLGGAVVNRDDAAGRRLLAHLEGRLPTWAYAVAETEANHAELEAIRADLMTEAANWLLGLEVRATAQGTALRVQASINQVRHEAQLEVPIIGRFNISNLLAVLGALLAAQVPFDAAINQLRGLRPVAGRMQRVGNLADADQPMVVVDFAHTPDALRQTLHALRPVTRQRGGALICVFGCGGDRDAAKRASMGTAAETLADQTVLTNDNPRSESPSAIIEQILQGMSQRDRVRCIEDRASAILQAVRGASRNDVILIAGKGHETTQETMGRKRPFSDVDHARLALAARAGAHRGDAS
jgi:UDP-N-acetylmuramoyl-L-alanyl-D-glutamate--2,6-diaminopimelate ligase